MAKITELTRCSGGNHLHFTIELTDGRTVRVTRDINELNIEPSRDDEYINQRLALLKREANARGATTFQQIRNDLLNREWVE